MRAVIFDFGMVLSGLPNAAAYAEMLRITGLSTERFEELYWADRHAYDEGKLSGMAYWRKFVRDAELALGPEAIDELHRWDAAHWTSENPAMLAWQEQLKARGVLTAILSNMGDSVLTSLEREFDWLGRFDVLVWSFQLGIAKPDPAIYKHVLEKLGTRPEETLFLDDKLVNIEAGRALGIRSIQFSTVEKLREELIDDGLDSDLPLPELNA